MSRFNFDSCLGVRTRMSDLGFPVGTNSKSVRKTKIDVAGCMFVEKWLMPQSE